MNFEELDERMRQYERALDLSFLPGVYLVARIDGRGFTRLTKETHPFEAPFDERFHAYMTATAEHLMRCGFRAVYGYTQSDEISLLFHRSEGLFDRKLRKYHSLLAAEASARFSLQLGAVACFDCRIAQLPTAELVVDYFQWRAEDAHRNALNAWCYWTLRKRGASVKEATDRLLGATASDKNELLFQCGINFNDAPAWQKRGTGLYWEAFEKTAMNPRTGRTATAMRRRLAVNQELPVKEEYRAFVARLAAQAGEE